jgi:hypothetical protein
LSSAAVPAAVKIHLQKSLKHGVILTVAVLQAERRACPERSRRDLAPRQDVLGCGIFSFFQTFSC